MLARRTSRWERLRNPYNHSSHVLLCSTFTFIYKAANRFFLLLIELNWIQLNWIAIHNQHIQKRQHWRHRNDGLIPFSEMILWGFRHTIIHSNIFFFLLYSRYLFAFWFIYKYYFSLGWQFFFSLNYCVLQNHRK